MDQNLQNEVKTKYPEVWGRRRGMVSETDFRWLGRTSSQVSQEMRATGLLLKTKKLTGEGNASV